MVQQMNNSFMPNSSMIEKKLPESLGEEFSLCQHGNMRFHWADFHETCDSVKEQIESDGQLQADFDRREANLNRLQLVPIWIRTMNKVHQTTMYDLYDRHILNQTPIGGMDTFGPLEISFISSSGPFKKMAIAECFNQNIYRDFVIVSLIKGQLPRRSFRLRLKAKILVEYGPEFAQASLMNLEQMTSAGLLLSVDEDFYYRELAPHQDLRILIDTSILRNALGKPLTDLKSHLGTHSFNLLYSARKEDSIACRLAQFSVQSGFDFFRSRKIYLFISYDQLAANSPSSATNCREFVAYSKEVVREYYQSVFSNLAAV
jgi:hypothetical protein